MTVRPTLSVLMAVYNSDRYLKQAIESILSQTFEDFELIVIDDGSSDRSLSILQGYATQDSRIRFISRENRGIPATRNELLSLAQGEFLAVLDSDDLALPDRFAQQIAFLQDHPEVVCVGGWFQMIDHRGRFLTTLEIPSDDATIQQGLLAGHCSICHSTVMMRRSAVLQVGGYANDLAQAEDLDLWLKLGEVGKLANLPMPVTQYRLHDRSISEQACLLQRQFARQACERAWNRRNITGTFEANSPWRPGTDRRSRHEFTLQYGWWAFHSGNRSTAGIYGLKAIRLIPYRFEGWKLLACALLKSPSAPLLPAPLLPASPPPPPQPVLISVIMPLYNGESYVLEAVRSILKEHRILLELIVVNDGSTDRSLKQLAQIQDDRLIILENQGKGIAAAMNTGIAAARGKFLARCDADDRYPAGRLFQQINWLMQHPEAGAVCGGYQAIDPRGLTVTSFDWSSKTEEITSELQAGQTRTHLCTYVVRLEIMRSIGGFRPYFATAEDIDLQLRLSDVTRIWYLPEVCYHYRIHSTSITHTKSSTEREFFDHIAREFQQQRQHQGSDALQQGNPPALPQKHDKPPMTAKQHLQGFLLGEAWRNYQTGQRAAALRTGMRSALTLPSNLTVWKSVLVLTVKAVGGRWASE
ncbi:glycosyltransferase family 2 protein [Leptolyngbya ohadii]|uniref:glycosyltransferase family 2 protein n=1 Tax=Leptolyngbya ohadii TaxID=1962290 RepID=UPI0019D44205|nr:glycosyltransferase [Leptolyngbya ohadii]